MAKEVTGL